MARYAWVTLATNDSYALGALVLAHSLKQVGTMHEIAVLVTSGVSNSMRQKLNETFDLVHLVDMLHSKDEENLQLLQRPELGVTFTKIHCWRLIKYDKCVFLDADTMILDNVDELFEREELSAAPDVGWPDCFNSGVFVYKPSLETFDKIVQFAHEKGSFDGADQGLLNLYFSDWAYGDISKHLPFIYNMCSTACYSYLPAYKQFGTNAKIIHFIGNTKPWLLHFNPEMRSVTVPSEIGYLGSILQKWWDIFCNLVDSSLIHDMGGMAGTLAELTLGGSRTNQQVLDDHLRRQCWESGNIDYLGFDSFANIWNKICQTITERSSEPQSLVPPDDSSNSQVDMPSDSDSKLLLMQSSQSEDAEVKKTESTVLKAAFKTEASTKINKLTSPLIMTRDEPTVIQVAPTLSNSEDTVVNVDNEELCIVPLDPSSPTCTSTTTFDSKKPASGANSLAEMLEPLSPENMEYSKTFSLPTKNPSELDVEVCEKYDQNTSSNIVETNITDTVAEPDISENQSHSSQPLICEESLTLSTQPHLPSLTDEVQTLIQSPGMLEKGQVWLVDETSKEMVQTGSKDHIIALIKETSVSSTAVSNKDIPTSSKDTALISEEIPSSALAISIEKMTFGAPVDLPVPPQ